ncbi:hypothetical protein NHQ30_005890 [Ciborinia camelliae]|nr:hypothetical protein NHQ30_005890 [Ciborinia camelliae]
MSTSDNTALKRYFDTNKESSHEDYRILVDRIQELILKPWYIRRYLRESQFGETVPENWMDAWAASTNIPREFLFIDEEILPISPPSCPRFDEIKEYLFENVSQLALDTTIYDSTHFGNCGSLIVRRRGWPQELLIGPHERHKPPIPPEWGSYNRPAFMAPALEDFTHDLYYMKNSVDSFSFNDRPDAEKEHVFFYLKFVSSIWAEPHWLESKNPFEVPGAVKPPDKLLTWSQFEYLLGEAIERTEQWEQSGVSLEKKDHPRVCNAPKGIVRVLGYDDDFYFSDDESRPPRPLSEEESSLDPEHEESDNELSGDEDEEEEGEDSSEASGLEYGSIF